MKAISTFVVAAAVFYLAAIYQVTQADFTCPRQDNQTVPTYYGDPDNCSAYYECDNKVAKHLSCPPGLEFNDDKHVCDYPDDAGCSVSVQIMEEEEVFRLKALDFECPVQTNESIAVLYSNPANCSTYYECDNGVAKLLECPPGLDFSEKDDVCVLPDDSDCVNSSK